MATAKKCSNEKKDRISELPTKLMNNIFKGIPIRDAARTSILSRKWRYIWASYPRLFFDENFFNEINTVKQKGLIQYEFTKAISNALLVHCGPINDFFLYIPNIPNDLSPEIDQWMSFLSRNGIKNLDLRNYSLADYILPSCIFSCNTLTDLSVCDCILKPPYAFEGFKYLINLSLEEISFSAALLHNTPLLESLKILYCDGIEYRSIYAPRLDCLAVIKSDEVDWQWVASNKQLTAVQIHLGIEVKNVEQTVTLLTFLRDLPKLEALWLDGFSLKYLATNNPHEVLQQQKVIDSSSQLRTSPSLEELKIHSFGVDDFEQILSVLCLLKNSPNMAVLKLVFDASTNNVTEPVAQYLEASNCMDLRLDMLKMVKIEFVKGLKAELLLVKLLLSCSTRLQSMVIQLDKGIDASNGYKISRELLRFPRASSNAEIIFLDPPTS